jgi:hypothetical protein
MNLNAGAAFPHALQVVEKAVFHSWSKTFRCKARDIMRNEAYCTVRRNDPENFQE